MHKAKACIISCIDFRFHKKLQEFVKKNGYSGHTDFITVAGAAHDLVCPETKADSDYLWKQIGISLKLHAPDEIVIIDHQDCGMYKATGEIREGMSLNEDEKVHQDLLMDLNAEFVKRFPGNPAVLNLWYATLQGEIIPLYTEGSDELAEPQIVQEELEIE